MTPDEHQRMGSLSRAAARAGADARPCIGVTLMLDLPERDRHAPRYSMNRAYFDALRQAGGIPVPLVPGDPSEIAWALGPEADRAREREGEPGGLLDGLCLTGGGDPDPALYGQPRRSACGEPEPERDALETALLARVRAGGLPLLAICRGIQILNVAWGGTLVQDIGSERPDCDKHDYFQSQGHARDHIAHPIEIAAGSRLRELLGGATHPVNSLHHQALDRLAPGLRVTARAPDGIVEAVELDGAQGAERFVLGVQFHPEELTAMASIRDLFAGFVAAAAEHRRGRLG